MQAGYLCLAAVTNTELDSGSFPSSGIVLHPLLALQGTGKPPSSYLSVIVFGSLSHPCCCSHVCTLFFWRSLLRFGGGRLPLRAAANCDLPQCGTCALEL